MGLFEFLMILVSVVIGLGVTEILTGWANLLRARASVRFYWVHVLLQVGVFLALLQQWWELWDMAEVGRITFGGVLTVLASPVLLFLMAHLLFPAGSDGADLRSYYYDQSRILWGLASLGALAGTVIPPLVFGYSLLHPANISGIPTLAFCLVLTASRNGRVHAVLVPAVILLVVLDTVLANPVIAAG